MRWIEKLSDRCRVKVRETFLNPILGIWRMKKLKNPRFTIISNNCWAGHVYRYFNLPYYTPTVGLYFFTDDYIRFLSNLKVYLSMDLKFIPAASSKYFEELKIRNEINRPIGLLGDVEIIFLHYKSEEEALLKWNRRRDRIHWNNLVVKMTEQNLCQLESLRQFDNLPFEKKIVFTSKDYGLKSQVVFGDYFGKGEVLNDTLHFRKYVNLIKLINGEIDFRRN